MNDVTIFQTNKWSSHFVKINTFQNQFCDGESGSLVRLYIYNVVSQMHATDMHLIH